MLPLLPASHPPRPHPSSPAARRVEERILQRLSGYPAAVSRNMHALHALLPLKAAHVLRQQPQLISSVMQAYFYR